MLQASCGGISRCSGIIKILAARGFERMPARYLASFRLQHPQSVHPCRTTESRAVHQALLQKAMHHMARFQVQAHRVHLSTLAGSRIPCLLGHFPLAALLGVQERGEQRIALADGACERAPRVVLGAQCDVVCTKLPHSEESFGQAWERWEVPNITGSRKRANATAIALQPMAQSTLAVFDAGFVSYIFVHLRDPNLPNS